jgi:hypothetical protein
MTDWDAIAKGFHYNSPQEMFEDLYWTHQMSLPQVAATVGKDQKVIAKAMLKYGIPKRKQTKHKYKKLWDIAT